MPDVRRPPEGSKESATEMRAARVLAAVLVTTLVASASCVRPRPPSSPVAAATDQELPYGGAPAVRDPMSLGKLAGDPCTEALTPEQVVAALGVPAVGKRQDLDVIGPACGWFSRDTGGAVGVSYTLKTHAGLSGVYENTRPQSAIWRVLPDVQGFPAVAHTDDRSGAFCQASVGLRDDTSIDISLTLGESKKGKADACILVAEIADMTVTTLKTRPG